MTSRHCTMHAAASEEDRIAKAEDKSQNSPITQPPSLHLQDQESFGTLPLCFPLPLCRKHSAPLRSAPGLPAHGAQAPAFGFGCPSTIGFAGFRALETFKHVMLKDQMRAQPPKGSSFLVS